MRYINSPVTVLTHSLTYLLYAYAFSPVAGTAKPEHVYVRL